MKLRVGDADVRVEGPRSILMSIPALRLRQRSEGQVDKVDYAVLRLDAISTLAEAQVIDPPEC
jgi:hypothetical protein